MYHTSLGSPDRSSRSSEPGEVSKRPKGDSALGVPLTLVMPVLRDSSLSTLSYKSGECQQRIKVKIDLKRPPTHEVKRHGRIETSNTVVPGDESSIGGQHLGE